MSWTITLYFILAIHSITLFAHSIFWIFSTFYLFIFMITNYWLMCGSGPGDYSCKIQLQFFLYIYIKKLNKKNPRKYKLILKIEIFSFNISSVCKRFQWKNSFQLCINSLVFKIEYTCLVSKIYFIFFINFPSVDFVVII